VTRELKSDVFLAHCPASYDDPWPGTRGPVYQSLCALWNAMGLDPNNPFGEWLAPGGYAVIKPNWVMDVNRSGQGMDCLVTHSTLVEFMIHGCAVAMKGRGRVVVGDCPLQGCDFPALMRQTRTHEVVNAAKRNYPELQLDVEDWRLTVLHRASGSSKNLIYTDQKLRHGDVAVSERYTVLDAASESFLEEISDYADRFRVTMYQPSLLQANHRRGVHKYLIRNDALDADLFINLAKMKTHEKAGLTAAMKNLVGVNGHKEYLPHHLRGPYFAGGDCYCNDNWFAARAEEVYDRLWETYGQSSRLQKWWQKKSYQLLKAFGRISGADHITPGGWSGNETIWRTTLDLNHLVYFGQRSAKKILNVIDGIIAGEGEGPLRPSPKPAGLIIAGENPASVDAVIARLMGYNLSRVPTVYHALHHRRSKFAGPCLADLPMWNVDAAAGTTRTQWDNLENMRFRLPRNWTRAARAL
jgi:uncharacterized protein (DUF362 family)